MDDEALVTEEPEADEPGQDSSTERPPPDKPAQLVPERPERRWHKRGSPASG